ncbi:MAG TPA: FHA domain-containing protein [Archangium sp.]|uniref:FHA domain-containing protein n=1 Tax=Archangium sp. TaxID=1872627 RepID=UPI002E31D600|nr:FHA domain-containing protein [Archangium sp.]HEX5752896.1 FHA domain-containing protein [Archangium sp.]
MSDFNERTRVAVLGGLTSRPSPLDAHDAFISAYDRLRGLAHLARQPAVLAVAVDAHARVVEAVLVESGHSLVIGRHTGCGLRLMSGDVSLRHLVLHAQSDAPGTAPVIRLWDLNTSHPFLTEDGQPNAAVRAQGLLYVSVGEYALLFLPTRGPSEPSWPERAEQAWRALPSRQFIDRRSPVAPRRLARSQDAEARGDHTNIVRLGPLRLLIGEHEGPEAAWGELRLESENKRERHRVSLERLEQGVLLGRYERCGILLAGLGQISRVHLLLVQVGASLLAIDTASTNGTWRGSTQIDTTLLEDSGSLELGDELLLQWSRLHA